MSDLDPFLNGNADPGPPGGRLNQIVPISPIGIAWEFATTPGTVDGQPSIIVRIIIHSPLGQQHYFIPAEMAKQFASQLAAAATGLVINPRSDGFRN
jgi:hypothetical protein